MRTTPLILFVAALTSAAFADPSDQDRARAAVLRGQFVPLEDILADAQRHQPGKVVEVDLEGDEYEVEILRPDGRVVELEYDARTGTLRGQELEED